MVKASPGERSKVEDASGGGGERKVPVVPPRHSPIHRLVLPIQFTQESLLLTRVLLAWWCEVTYAKHEFSSHTSPVKQSRCEETDRQRHVHLLPTDRCALEIFYTSAR